VVGIVEAAVVVGTVIAEVVGRVILGAHANVNVAAVPGGEIINKASPHVSSFDKRGCGSSSSTCSSPRGTRASWRSPFLCYDFCSCHFCRRPHRVVPMNVRIGLESSCSDCLPIACLLSTSNSSSRRVTFGDCTAHHLLRVLLLAPRAAECALILSPLRGTCCGGQTRRLESTTATGAADWLRGAGRASASQYDSLIAADLTSAGQWQSPTPAAATADSLIAAELMPAGQ
jgi:hypothetical protein